MTVYMTARNYLFDSRAIFGPQICRWISPGGLAWTDRMKNILSPHFTITITLLFLTQEQKFEK